MTSNVIKVEFGRERDNILLAADIENGMLEIGELLGDDPSHVRLKAARFTELLLAIGSISGTVSIRSVEIPGPLREDQIEAITRHADSAAQAVAKEIKLSASKLLIEAEAAFCTSYLLLHTR